MGLRSYPATKDSGEPWLGELPEHWQIKRLAQCGTIAGGMTPSMENRRFWGGNIPWVTPKDMKVARIGKSSVLVTDQALHETSLRLIHPPAVLLVVRGMILARRVPIAWISAPVTVNQDMKALIPRLNLTAEFLSRFLEASQNAFTPLIDTAGHGTCRLPTERLRSLSVPLPPLPEQRLIVRYLNYVDRRIQRYIRAKQQLIKLLEEQKRATIHRAVTRGFDPEVRLKPSGVEWLGEVPEHWDVMSLKHASAIQTGLTLGKSYKNSATKSYPYLRVANVQAGRLDLHHVKTIEVPESEVVRCTLRPGDVLMTEGGDIDKLGRGCVWDEEIPGCLHQNHIFAVRCQEEILLPTFLVRLMESEWGRTYFQLTAKQTTNLASTNSSTLRALPIPLPPVAEQSQIVEMIGEKTEVVDLATYKASREINLLREYRTRLIADVVTGKLDVREVAAGLPDESNDLEPLDDLELDEAAPDSPDALENTA